MHIYIKQIIKVQCKTEKTTVYWKIQLHKKITLSFAPINTQKLAKIFKNNKK